MIYNKFVNNFKVSNICFGTWNLSTSSRKFLSPENFPKGKSKELIKFAIYKGINFFDTADIYGEGKSEKILGEAVKNLREKIFIITKGGVLNRKNETNFSVSYINKKIQKSLKNLKTEYIDGYQLHNLKSSDKIGLLVKNLEKMKINGIINSIGFSSRDPFDAVKILKKYNFDFFQVSFSVFDQRLLKSDIFNILKKKKCFLITRSPFNSGFLLGKDIKEYFLNKNLRNKIKLFKKNYESKIIYDNHNFPLSALKFCMSYKQISSIIVGMSSKSEIEENCSIEYSKSSLEKKWKYKLEKLDV